MNQPYTVGDVSKNPVAEKDECVWHDQKMIAAVHLRGCDDLIFDPVLSGRKFRANRSGSLKYPMHLAAVKSDSGNPPE